MIEGLLVTAAVVGATAHVLRRAARLLRHGGTDGCGCASTGACPATAPLAEGIRRAARRAAASRRP